MASTVLSPTRALRQPRRIDARMIVGVGLFIIATSGSVAFWTTSSDTRSVLLATRDLPAGATLRPTDLATTRVRVDDGVYAAAIPAAELSRLVGKPLAEPVHAQEILVAAQVASRPALPAGQLAMTIATSPETAVGGRVRAGDTVEVFVTTNKGKPEAQSAVVLPRALVYDVGYDTRPTVVNTIGANDAGNATSASGPIRWLTLVVSPDQAQALARAKWQGEIDVALLPPEEAR